VVVLPLLRNEGLAGLLEVFSSRAGGFGERDEITLEALGRRVLKNLERAREVSFASSAGSAGVQANRSEKMHPAAGASELKDPRDASATMNIDEIPAESLGRSPRTGVDVVTYALGAAVVACAVLLAILVGLRVSSPKIAATNGTAPATSAAVVEPGGGDQGGAGQIAGALGSNAVAPPAANSMVSVGDKKNVSGASTVAGRVKDNVPPAGSLLVYEDGKEIFRRMPDANGTGVRKDEGGVQRASAVEPVAEGSLVYRVEPEYPEAARRQNMQGAVALDVRIGGDGGVQDVKVVSGERMLADAAIAAVKQWKFKPRLVQGQPVEMESKITLYFKMPE
jgi:TonB family protein